MDGKQTKKELIASVAKELFSKYGFKMVSMDKIAAKSDVAKGTVYLYFKDKDELFQYLLDESIREIRSIMEDVMAQELLLCDEIAEVVYRLLLYRKQHIFLFRIFSEAHELQTQMARSGVQQINNEVQHYLINRFSGMKNLNIDKVNIEGISFIIIKAYSALAFEWEEEHEPLDERQIADMIGHLLRGSLCQQ